MPITSVEFMSLCEAEAFVPSAPTVAISLLSPGRAPAALSRDLVAVLRCYFHDAAKNSPLITLFSDEHARAIATFIATHHATADPYHLLVHCEAGISRSAAVAVFAASECRVPLSGYFAALNPLVLQRLLRVTHPHYAFDEIAASRVVVAHRAGFVAKTPGV